MVFVDMTLEVQVKTAGKLNIIKGICASKNTVKEMRRQCTELEKVFSNHISDKGLASRIYKELLQLNNEKANNPVKNGQRI